MNKSKAYWLKKYPDALNYPEQRFKIVLFQFISQNLTTLINSINKDKEVISLKISPDNIISLIEKLDIENIIKYFIDVTNINWTIIKDRDIRKFHDLILPFFKGFSEIQDNSIFFRDYHDINEYNELLNEFLEGKKYNSQKAILMIDNIFGLMEDEERDCIWELLTALVGISINFIHYKRQPVMKPVNGVDSKGYCTKFMENIKIRNWANLFNVKLIFRKLEQ